jgi:hypothetical protein
VALNGFGNSKNDDIQSLLYFGSYLYAGTNNVDGCQVWRTSLVFNDGFGTGDTSRWSGAVP